MNRLLLPAALAATLFLTACGTTGEAGGTEPTGSDTKAQYEKTIVKAEAAYKDVEKLGGAWTITQPKIDDAKKAAQANDYKKALEFAKQAYDESLLAKQQFESQRNAGPYLF